MAEVEADLRERGGLPARPGILARVRERFALAGGSLAGMRPARGAGGRGLGAPGGRRRPALRSARARPDRAPRRSPRPWTRPACPAGAAACWCPARRSAGAILRVHGMPPLDTVRLPGVGPARRRDRSPSRCSASARTATERPRCTEDLEGADAVMVTREQAGGAARAERRRDHHRPALARSLVSGPTDGDLLPPLRPRDRGLLLELRPADLPGLHDVDLRGHALPGVREPEDEGQDDRLGQHEPTLTYVLIGINVAVAFGAFVGGASATGGRWAELVAAQRRVRVALHDRPGRVLAPPHRGLPAHRAASTCSSTCSRLYILGGLIEPAVGRLRFGVIYFVSLLAGSFGALLLEPTAPTVGASGAIFGLMGAAVVVMRNRGINPMESGIGLWIGLNLLITFTIPNISIGGHIGGLDRRGGRGG